MGSRMDNGPAQRYDHAAIQRILSTKLKRCDECSYTVETHFSPQGKKTLSTDQSSRHSPVLTPALFVAVQSSEHILNGARA